ncbi:MAG: substrate-binding domain-containing protein [Loktanella sp.]|jgi:LacI family transcriptional regulator|nr:substrate-binding domain-containing protein [Loktanella sp.]MDO7624468.1 substrate-binding domain-containing protein [Loktanella sp.]MDO7626636.1 substrate-binding domain-containing protein [Loktanella sp.]MDO7665302.1 substrate-binding domain-containing protein [Loktanella sp.]MDO7685412.1 substrate-binding domain-containing protein [Loktanella sp.]
MNLKQLSSALGLSQTTVSRALNGYPEVSEATRIKVELAAKQHNYNPSSRAKGLATGKALAIGHVIPVSTKHEMVNPIFGDFIAGAGEAYSRNGYEMVLSIVDDQNEESIYRGLKSRRAVDGVVVHGPTLNDPRIPLLNEIGLPFVVHGRSSGATSPYAWLDVNNKRAFHRAANFLYDLGHRRIGLVNGLEGMDFAHRRRAGYEETLRTNGIDIDPAIMRTGEMTEDFGFQSTREMLALDHRPTAIMTASMISALGVRRAIEDAGLVMGRDVSVVTHDDALSYLRNGGDIPIFTATRSSVREAGRRLAEMLLSEISEPSETPPNQLLEAELMVGLSTGPAPKDI